ncbi:MAG: methylenetetrahydrofolate reductase [Proteobacteria bacterium]|nr:methylenetetrahydrofolate reductase [Pseudomonadota bacterium]
MSKKTFQEALSSGKFVVTTEVGPPKGTNIERLLSAIDLLKDRVDGINVTDNQSSVMRVSSLAICHLVQEKGGEAILQQTCRDRNRMALESELLGANVLGIHNLLCLTGDHLSAGDHQDAQPVFDLDSVQLIQIAKMMEAGKDSAGNELKGAVKFCVGATVNPGANPLEPQLLKFEKKIAAGAQFFQTQAVYDVEGFARFMKQVEGFKVPILAGVIPLKSPGMAKYMNENVAGVSVPDRLIEEMTKAENKEAKGIEIAARLIKDLKGVCPGVHIMAIGWEEKVPEILSQAGIG